MKKIGILGATGRMGSALMELSLSPHMELIPLKKLEVISDPLHALIDFSHVDATQHTLATALSHQLPIVIGTTGHTPMTWDLIEQAALKIPVLYSSNFSIGITLIKQFIKRYTSYLEQSYVDIFETHHLEKKDLPSGTALDLAALFTQKHLLFSCPQKRSEADLLIHSHRLPSHPGSHTVQLTFKEESLSLHHEVFNRKVYAQGALMATQFLLKQNSGLYSFADVFNI